jgi:hypothetical protein
LTKRVRSKNRIRLLDVIVVTARGSHSIAAYSADARGEANQSSKCFGRMVVLCSKPGTKTTVGDTPALAIVFAIC